MRSSGSQISLNGILSVKNALPGAEQSVLLGAREVVVAKQRGGVARCRPSSVRARFSGNGSGPGNCCSANCRSSLTNDSSPPARTAEWLASTCSISVVPERGKPMMKIGCGTSGAARRARQQLARCARTKKRFRRAKNVSTAWRVVGQAAGLGRKQPLALDEIAPRLVVAAEPVEQAAAFEPRIAVERRRRVEDRQRFVRLARCARGELARSRSTSLPGDAAAAARRASRQRSRQVAAHLAELRPVRERAQRRRARAHRRARSRSSASSVRPCCIRLSARFARNVACSPPSSSARRKCHSPEGRSLSSDRIVPNRL